MTNRSSKRDDDRRQPVKVGKAETKQSDHIPPVVTGQCAQVLNLIREHQPILSLTITADMAVPECAARVHDLRAAGWNIITAIRPVVLFRGIERRNVAAYSLGVPEWPSPGFFDAGPSAVQIELDLKREAA